MAAGLAGSISSTLAFAAKVPLLMKATSNDEKPTQGYVLQEISNISKASLGHCLSLLNFLVGRLEKKSPHIKFKVLNLMKYLVINGHSEFRSGLRRNAEAIKQTASFIGELDPLHGDGLNLNVHQTAAELELLLFDVDNPDVAIMCQSMVAPNQSGKKMEGFGHSGAPPLKKEPSFMDTLKKVKDSVPEIVYKMNPTKSHESPSVHQPSCPLPSLYNPVNLQTDLEDQELEISPDSSGISSEGHCPEICEETSQLSTDCHYYERKLVNDITAKGGIRSTPSKEALKVFVDKMSSLEFQVILQLLDERLQDSSHDIQLKSLCVIEYLLRCNLGNISHSIKDCCSNIHTLAGSNDPALQAKAKKIALTVESCLKQELDCEDKANPPPNYDLAKELPKVEERQYEEYEKQVTSEVQRNTELESLFSGMNFSTHSFVDPPVTTSTDNDLLSDAPDLLGDMPVCTEQVTGTTSGLDFNCESSNSVDIFDPLIQFENIELKVETPRRSQVGLILRTEDSESNMNLQNVNSPNIGNTREVKLNGVSPQSNLFQSSTTDLFSLQPSLPGAPLQSAQGGLVPITHVSPGPSGRRQFPKDMKQEANGFGFLQKSAKKDAFSFVSDEIAARKTKPK